MQISKKDADDIIAEVGKTTYDVTKNFFCPQSKVMYWKKRYYGQGIDGFRTKEKQGRPKYIHDRTEEVIKRELSGKD